MKTCSSAKGLARYTHAFSFLARRRYALVALFEWLCLAGRVAHAERGEFETRLSSGHEVAFLRYPGAGHVWETGAAHYVPRFGMHLGFGLTHALSLGVSPSASLPQNILVHVVDYQDVREGRLVSTYHDILLPAVAEMGFVRGTSWAWGVSAGAGLALTHWSDVYMTSLGPSASLDVPIIPQSSWHALGYFELGMHQDFRPGDTFGLRLGAQVGVKHQGDVHLGLTLSGNGFFGIGG